MPSIAHLRRYAIARTLFPPTSLPKAIARLGFVQADPIRAPARAQDLTLRHRVKDYRAGQLEQRYHRLAIEEDFFVNYGFLPRATQALMHPRTPRTAWTKTQETRAAAVLAFVHEAGVVHPAQVDAHFQHGKITNWFGGSSNATTQLLDQMHYRGLLRVARRESGARMYAVREPHTAPLDGDGAMDALVDVIVNKYAPFPERSLSELVSKLRGGAPQWAHSCRAAFQRAKTRLEHAKIDDVTWYWPANETPRDAKPLGKRALFLAPFDPLVWDRRRFELLWGWAYRFEAYVPAAKRVRGHYALPLLWGDSVIGWGNISAARGQLHVQTGFVRGAPPTERSFRAALDEELDRFRIFLNLRHPPQGN